jgi:copper chaperone NosL
MAAKQTAMIRQRQIATVLLPTLCALITHGCSTEPEPLSYGIDACYSCKMTLVDNRFGAELVTKKGKVYKFDDLNCMLNFYHAGEVDASEFYYKLVINYEKPGIFLNADEAFYVKSKEIRSPMASELAAFESYDRAMVYRKQWEGIFLAWGEVTTQFK